MTDPLLEMMKAAVREVLAEVIHTTDLRTQRLVKPEEAGEYLGMSRSNIYRLMNEGQLPSVQAERLRLLDKDDLDQWIKDHKRHGEQNQRVA